MPNRVLIDLLQGASPGGAKRLLTPPEQKGHMGHTLDEEYDPNGPGYGTAPPLEDPSLDPRWAFKALLALDELSMNASPFNDPENLGDLPPGIPPSIPWQNYLRPGTRDIVADVLNRTGSETRPNWRADLEEGQTWPGGPYQPDTNPNMNASGLDPNNREWDYWQDWPLGERARGPLGEDIGGGYQRPPTLGEFLGLQGPGWDEGRSDLGEDWIPERPVGPQLNTSAQPQSLKDYIMNAVHRGRGFPVEDEWENQPGGPWRPVSVPEWGRSFAPHGGGGETDEILRGQLRQNRLEDTLPHIRELPVGPDLNAITTDDIMRALENIGFHPTPDNYGWAQQLNELNPIHWLENALNSGAQPDPRVTYGSGGAGTGGLASLLPYLLAGGV